MSTLGRHAPEAGVPPVVVAALALAGALGVGAPFAIGAVGLVALLRGAPLGLTLLCLASAAPVVELLPTPLAARGVVPAVAAAVAAAVVERASRRRERPVTVGVARTLACAAVAASGVLALRRLGVAVAEGARAWWPALQVIPLAVVAAGLVRSSRASRPSRGLLREASLWCLGAAAVRSSPDDAAPFAVFAIAALEGFEALPRGAALPGVLLAVLLRGARAGALPVDAALVAAAVIGLAARAIGTAAFPAFGARLRLLERAKGRLMRHEGVHTHRVALALAEPSARFGVDWHRPPVQLVVERIGVLRAIPALPAPELVQALVAAPMEVVAFDEVHPYTVGAADVHAAQRSLEVRGAAAAVLLRDAESKEITGVLYVLGGTGAPLAEDEAQALHDVGRAVSASIGAGTEPAIAARLRG